MTIYIYASIGLLVFLILAPFVAALIEKRMVWPYGSPEAEPRFADSSVYGARWVGEALDAGFSLLGWSPDLKGPIYQVNYALLVSPDRDCFVIVGVGAIANMTLRGTWIYTPTTDGAMVYTTDNQSCVEIDVLRQWRSQLAPASRLPHLLRRHQDMIRDLRVTPRPFVAGREAEEFRSLREEHFQEMSRRGLIVFTDASATHWRYTFRGAAKWAVLNLSIGLLRGVTFGRIPGIA